MGLTPTSNDIGSSPAQGRDAARPAPPATKALPNAVGGLAALLGSEDSLFRDPFADFAPSRR
jgi:hypothetical protein